MKKSKPTARKRTMAKKTTRKSTKQRSTFARIRSDSRLQFLSFAVLFAVVGSIFAFYTLAATATTSFSGSLNKKNPTRSHSITTTASGTFTATGSASTKGKNASSIQLTLQLKTVNGTLIAQTTGDPATLSAPVGIGSYTMEVSSTASSANYTVNVSYPIADPTPVPDTTAPTAPASLTAVATSTSQVNLSWQSATDNVGVASYQIYRNGVMVTTTMTTTYTDVNLTPATAYSYTVRAKDAAGNLGPASNIAVATTQTPVDTTVPNLSITSPINDATVNGTVTLSGQATDNIGISKVEVQVGTGTGYVPATYSATAASYSYSLNTTLYPDASLPITVRAIDTSGNQKTASISVTIQNNIAPPPPTTAPETQGVWVSPEGLTIDVNTVQINPATNKLWTIADVYPIVKIETTGSGDFNTIAPNVTFKLQDQTGGFTGTTARSSNGIYSKFSASVYVGGPANKSFWAGTNPRHQVVAHEFGHVWSLYHKYMSNAGSWGGYDTERWANADGSIRLKDWSGLGAYPNEVTEIIADDYRWLFGSPASYNNAPIGAYFGRGDLIEPRAQPGLRDWFLNVYAK